jgi:hypothetical protein
MKPVPGRVDKFDPVNARPGDVAIPKELSGSWSDRVAMHTVDVEMAEPRSMQLL